jgi:acetylornithine deacetylase/succinyl-diaminopimelate desuccinylase-like protein
VTDGRLPVNVVFLIEGEEENSSASLEGFVAKHNDTLVADVTLSADGAQWRYDLPSIIVGSRGICSLEVVVRSAAKDLHSGRHGGSIANPIQALVGMLAGLHTPDGSIAVPGFYDRVRPVTDAERRAIAAIPFDETAYLASVGARPGAGEAGYGLLERNWLRPTLEFNGIVGGYTGPGRKTVIPAEASAKLTCRLVPDQEPIEIAGLVADRLRALAPETIAVTVRIVQGGSRPYALSQDHAALARAERVLADLTGQAPVRVRMGATVPIGDVFRRHLGIETIFFSFSTSDEDYHAPNEFFRLESLERGLKAWARLLRSLVVQDRRPKDEACPYREHETGCRP